MSQCANCGNQLSCGCQRRTASNGTQVCSSCLSAYETSLQQKSSSNSVDSSVLNTFTRQRNKSLQKFIK
jgi:transcription elongation factor Elf1